EQQPRDPRRRRPERPERRLVYERGRDRHARDAEPAERRLVESEDPGPGPAHPVAQGGHPVPDLAQVLRRAPRQPARRPNSAEDQGGQVAWFRPPKATPREERTPPRRRARRRPPPGRANVLPPMTPVVGPA